GNQHLLSFKTKENLIKTKGELSDYINKTNGKMFFNGDNLDTKTMADAYQNEKVISMAFEKNNTIYATDLEYDMAGVNFTLVCGETKIKTTARLLGFHNISNIVLCANVCLSLGLTIEEIERGIQKLVPSAHRLALVPSSEALIVIDDAYNGSVEGASAALEVLASYKTKKIVITPGLVELGKEQYSSNKQLGLLIAKKADYVIINGTTNFEALEEGLKEGGMAEEKILRAGSLKQAVTQLYGITEPGDVVLFENDLPDNYN
ncbi:MAG: UDP-N-acetylmuramoyl-tripeptide--D-alanyl-D-alanine ligase, partial [Clostridia bacterium]|nr:UDP-N-acetylmuramoyl-tripeptide--D-alanyl-D-alanine ligase [Clostridia bacterium]